MNGLRGSPALQQFVGRHGVVAIRVVCVDQVGDDEGSQDGSRELGDEKLVQRYERPSPLGGNAEIGHEEAGGARRLSEFGARKHPVPGGVNQVGNRRGAGRP